MPSVLGWRSGGTGEGSREGDKEVLREASNMFGNITDF